MEMLAFENMEGNFSKEKDGNKREKEEVIWSLSEFI